MMSSYLANELKTKVDTDSDKNSVTYKTNPSPLNITIPAVANCS